MLTLVPAEIAWAYHQTPALFKREAPVRVSARHEAAVWLAATSRTDDILFGYEPLYLAAWELHRSAVSNTVVPRADAKLALADARRPGESRSAAASGSSMPATTTTT